MRSLYVRTVFIFLIVVVFHSSHCLKTRGSDCPQMYSRTYEGYIPKGNDTAGTYIFFENITDIERCISKCCNNKSCNAVVMFNKKCYNVDCKTNENCIPELHHNPKLRDNVTMVLVKPDKKNESWVKILKEENWKESCPKLYEYTYRGYLPRGNMSTGTFGLLEEITDFKNCILKCCENAKCNVAIMYDHKCYNVGCKSSKLCIPSLHHHAPTRKSIKMVLVKPVDHDDEWKEILKKFREDEENSDEVLPEITSKEEETTTTTVTTPKSAWKLSHINLRLPDFQTQENGKQLKVEWTQINGPTILKFLRQNETSFDITRMIAGNYVINLTISENEKCPNGKDCKKIEDATEYESETTEISTTIIDEPHVKKTL